MTSLRHLRDKYPNFDKYGPWYPDGNFKIGGDMLRYKPNGEIHRLDVHDISKGNSVDVYTSLIEGIISNPVPENVSKYTYDYSNYYGRISKRQNGLPIPKRNKKGSSLF
jgi:hypothetical protein